MLAGLPRLAELPSQVTRWFHRRPATVDLDEVWADEFIDWIQRMRDMDGTRRLRRPLPYPVTSVYVDGVERRSA